MALSALVPLREGYQDVFRPVTAAVVYIHDFESVVRAVAEHIEEPPEELAPYVWEVPGRNLTPHHPSLERKGGPDVAPPFSGEGLGRGLALQNSRRCRFGLVSSVISFRCGELTG